MNEFDLTELYELKPARRAKSGEAKALIMQVAHTPDELLPDRCLHWPFAIKPNSGYGVYTLVPGKSSTANRSVQIIRDGVHVDYPFFSCHKCKNKSCFNPLCLKWGTPLENTKDRYRDGTILFGEDNHRSLITDEQARLAHKYVMEGKTRQEAADLTGVPIHTVKYIALGKSRTHLGLPSLRKNAARCTYRVHGIVHESTQAAALATGCSTSTIRRRALRGHPGYEIV